MRPSEVSLNGGRWGLGAVRGGPYQDGVVFFVQVEGGGVSNSLLVNHENGWMSVYAHMLHRPPFAVGDRIRKGDLIGVEDTTGVATGPHLHFELRWNNVGMDPVTALVIGPDFTVAALPPPVPQLGDPSPMLSLSELTQLQALLGNGQDDPCERCGHGGLDHSATGPIEARPCYNETAPQWCPCTGYRVDPGPAALREAVKRRLRVGLDTGAPEAPYSEPVRDEESPTYRQHMRDAGRGGMLR